VMQVVRSGTRRKTVNALGFEDIEPLIVIPLGTPRYNAPSLDFWWLGVLSATREFKRAGRLVINRLSDNVVPVKHFLSALTRALRRVRHFAVVDGSAIPTQARS
jgi:hypothetical protein